MKWIDKLRGKPADPPPEHAVLVDVTMPDDPTEFGALRDAIFALEDRLARIVAAGSLGEFDGDEFGEGVCRLYLYGPDGDALFAAIEDELRTTLSGSATVITRHGPPGSPERRREL